jgi:hypothetical protein
VCAFDLDPLAGAQRVLLNLLEQSSAPDTAHLYPPDRVRRIITLTLLGGQLHGETSLKRAVVISFRRIRSDERRSVSRDADEVSLQAD